MSKIFPLLLFGVALFIAGNAAYFSVKGIGLLFAGSFIPVIVMASSLELGKLFAVSLLYRKWYDMARLLRIYLSVACVLLIGITSLGIFGFLTDAYQDTKAKVSYHQAEIDSLVKQNNQLQDQINLIQSTETTTSEQAASSTTNYKEIYDKYEKRQTDRIKQLNVRLGEMDQAMSDLQAGPGGLFSSKKKKIEQLKVEQQPGRESLAQEIKSINDFIKAEYEVFLNKVDELAKVNDDTDTTTATKSLYDTVTVNEKQILVHKSSINSTDIGSFQFIADSFGMQTDQAVKWFIVLIVIVFDPLAICLVIGFNMYAVNHELRNEIKNKKDVTKMPVKTNKQNKRVVVLGRGHS